MTHLRDIALLLFAADAVVLLALILRTYSRRWYRPLLRSDAAARRARRDAKRLVRELDEWAGEIDQKICVRLAELRELTERAEAAASRLTRAGDGDLAETVHADLHDMHEPPPATPATTATTATTTTKTFHDALGPSTYASHAEVRRLSDSGLEPLAIARRLGRPLGEIELIIKLSVSRDEVQMATGRKQE